MARMARSSAVDRPRFGSNLLLLDAVVARGDASDEPSSSERRALLETRLPRYPLDLSRSAGDALPAHASLRLASSDEYRVLVPDPHTGLPTPRRTRPPSDMRRRLALGAASVLGVSLGLLVVWWYLTQG